MGMGQVVYAIDKVGAKHFTIGANASYGDTSKVHPVVTALTANKPGATGITFCPVVAEGYF